MWVKPCCGLLHSAALPHLSRGAVRGQLVWRRWRCCLQARDGALQMSKMYVCILALI
jgi:hypothetical protein